MVELKLEIIKIVVMINQIGADEIQLHTNLPTPFPDWSEDKLVITTDIKHNYGVEYTLKVFKQDIEVVNCLNGNKSIIKYNNE